MSPFVKEFLHTSDGDVPRLKTSMRLADRLDRLCERAGRASSWRKVVNGLYCVGFPDSDSPVVVVPADRPRFDSMRRGLAGLDTWVLAVGPADEFAGSANVEDLERVVKDSTLSEHVRHNRLEVPVGAFEGVSELLSDPVGGYELAFGPARAEQWWDYFENGRNMSEGMKRPVLLFKERASLGFAQFLSSWQAVLVIVACVFALSCIDGNGLSLQAGMIRGQVAALSVLIALSAGMLGPLFFWKMLPGKSVGAKGAFGAIYTFFAFILLVPSSMDLVEIGALLTWSIAAGAFQAERLIGSTPLFCCRSLGKRYQPLQAFLALVGGLLWVWAGYVT